MPNVDITKLLLGLIVSTILIWDTYLIYSGDKAATFSVVLYESSRQWPVIAFALGFLCGHVFWQIYSRG
jgi:hypothetical protein|tara:strand:+ start:198 stop:404 length:207 start_codon:yes stop_codon:yes gene_type:complete